MNLIALVLGLVLEKLLTRWLHLREPHWFDGYFDWSMQHLARLEGAVAILAAALVALVPVLPVLVFVYFFHNVLLGVPYLVFATVVLLFALGPRDLGANVEEYVLAQDAGDEPRAEAAAAELLERPMPVSHPERIQALREAIFVQANNRLFGVIFWFLLLGPAGAWLFRVTDLMRKRAVHSQQHPETSEASLHPGFERAILRCHGVLAWPSARLLALGYALAGSFEDAVSDWRAYYQNTAEHFFEVNNDILAAAGCGAQGVSPAGEDLSADGICELEADASRSAMRLVVRTLVVWVTFIALATLLGWTV